MTGLGQPRVLMQRNSIRIHDKISSVSENNCGQCSRANHDETHHTQVRRGIWTFGSRNAVTVFPDLVAAAQAGG
jgi:hypothetical protein